MLRLKLQHFGHLMWRTDSLEKILMLGKIEGGRRRDDRGWDGWMVSLTWRTRVWASSGSWWWTAKPGVLPSMGSQSRTLLSNWTDWIAGLSPVMWLNQYHFSCTHYVLDWVSQDVYEVVSKLESMSKSPRELVTTQIPGLHLQIFWVSRPGVGSDCVHFKPVPRWWSSRK